MKIHVLPYAILLEALTFLNTKEQAQMRLVCKLWNRIIKEIYYNGILKIDERNLIKFKKNKHLVKRLVFNKVLEEEMNCFDNLEELQFIYKSSIKDDAHLIEILTHFKKLKKLSMVDNPSLVFNLKVINLFSKLNSICFSNMKMDEVKYYNINKQWMYMNQMEWILSNLNKSNLHSLEMHNLNKAITQRVIKIISDKFINLNILKISNLPFNLAQSTLNQKYSRLKHLSLTNIANDPDNKIRININNFKCLIHLELLFCNDYHYTSIPLMTTSTWHNLKSLHIDTRIKLDYKVMPNLEELNILSTQHHNEVKYDLNTPFSNLTKLKKFICLYSFIDQQFKDITIPNNLNVLNIGFKGSIKHVINFIIKLKKLTSLKLNFYDTKSKNINIDLKHTLFLNLLTIQCENHTQLESLIKSKSPNVL